MSGFTGLGFEGWLGVCQAGRRRVGGEGGVAGSRGGVCQEGSLPHLLHLRSCPPCAQVKHLGVLHLASSPSSIENFSQSYRLPAWKQIQNLTAPAYLQRHSSAPNWSIPQPSGAAPRLSLPLSVPPSAPTPTRQSVDHRSEHQPQKRVVPAPLRTCHIRICVLRRSPGDSHTHYV